MKASSSLRGFASPGAWARCAVTSAGRLSAARASSSVAKGRKDVTEPPVAGRLICRRDSSTKGFLQASPFFRVSRKISLMATFTLRINGRTHEIEGEAGDSLLSVLRYDLGLTGSKFGCGEGYCGACTVLARRPGRPLLHRRASAAASRKPITTIEGHRGGRAAASRAGSVPRGRSVPVRLLHARHGHGHGRPASLHPNPSDQDIARLMDRNVCRCGTYARIVRAMKLAASNACGRARSSGRNRR